MISHPMKYRQMGKHGIKLSEISIGTMYYGSYIGKEMGVKNLDTAVGEGINFIDCADRYGIKDNELPPDQTLPAEQVVGEFLKNHEREDLVLSSKVHHHLRDSPNSGGLSRKHIMEQVQVCLANMRTDYLDLYYCHRHDPDTPLEETIRTMTNLVDDGLIHYWGTSWWPPHVIERTIGIARSIGCIPPVVEQPPYHMRARFIEPDLMEVARYHGIGITAFEGLSLGLFTGKYNDSIPAGSRFDKQDLVTPEFMAQLQEKLKEIQSIADELGLEMYQLALAWVLHHKEISSTIMGASKPDQVRKNATASGISLTDEVVERLNAIHPDKEPVFRYRYT